MFPAIPAEAGEAVRRQVPSLWDLNLLSSCPTVAFLWIFGSWSQKGGAVCAALTCCSGLGGCPWIVWLSPHVVSPWGRGLRGCAQLWACPHSLSSLSVRVPGGRRGFRQPAKIAQTPKQFQTGAFVSAKNPGERIPGSPSDTLELDCPEMCSPKYT